jgi:hypothetical protein
MSEDEEEMQRLQEEERLLAEGSETDRIRLKYLRHRREQERDAMYADSPHTSLGTLTPTVSRLLQPLLFTSFLFMFQAQGQPHQTLSKAKVLAFCRRNLKGK